MALNDVDMDPFLVSSNEPDSPPLQAASIASASVFVGLARQAYRAFGQRDIAQLQSLCTRDCVWQASGLQHYMPWAGVHLGHEGIAEFVAALDADLRFDKFEAWEFFPGLGAKGEPAVFVTGRAQCTVKRTGLASA